MKKQKFASHTKSYSFQAVLRTITVFLAALSIVLFTIVSTVIVNENREKTRIRLANTLELNEDAICTDLLYIENLISMLPYYSADFSEVVAPSSDTAGSISIKRLQRLMQGMIPCMQSVDGLYVYFNEIDQFVAGVNGQDVSRTVNQIRDAIRQEKTEKTLEEIAGNQWQIVQLDETWYIKKEATSFGDTLIGAVIQCDKIIEELTTTCDYPAEYALMDPDGAILFSSIGESNNDELSLLYSRVIHAPDEENDQLYGEMIAGTEYYTCVLRNAKWDFCIMLMFDLSLKAGVFTSDYIYLGIMLAVLILAVLLIVWLFRRMIIRPFEKMEEINQQLSDEERSTQLIIPEVQCVEIQRSLNVVGKLHQRSMQLQENYYNEKLLRTKAEMDRYKSQIAPHFLINCLYAIQNMAENGYAGNDVFTQIISTLSEHLRYSLSSREKVPLKEELFYTENYIRLTQLRFPGCLEYSITADDNVGETEVFPLILLMLTENTIKHNRVMDNNLIITIDVSKEIADDKCWIVLKHSDNGKGFPDDILRQLEQDHYIHDTTSEHIGVNNTIQRLHFMFPEAEITFSNSPGATITIRIPYALP